MCVFRVGGTHFSTTLLKISKIFKPNLNFSKKGLGVASATVIACLIPVSASLTSVGEDGLNLKHNDLGDKGWGAIFAAVCGSRESKITSIDAGGEGIGAEGAKVIGRALQSSVSASLTQVLAF